ncbi:SUMO-activating enzyme subunit 1-like [Saccostrea echinata]|uniref:SUMO-activating enzyme subunit 1-like n=1 Tax=Saccostrea echinata TaxID=191078 RepID=UPI002A7ED152|nr:SUMO-activating enzyme subunit 1-like [Saccostrea echinata]
MGEEMNITEDEAALYDRQIRLWGLDAQRRLRAAKVLLIGLKGLGAEITKNIVLAGIKSITLLDNTKSTEEDSCSQFLISRADLGKNRAEASLEHTQRLNPMVEVVADTQSVEDKADKFFTKFDVVCATCCKQSTLLRINKICSAHNIKFFGGDVFGFYGFMFSDLGEHEYAEEVPKPKPKDEEGEPAAKKAKKEETEMVTVKKSVSFSRLQSALDIDWSSQSAQRKLKRIPNTYFIMQVLHDFMNNNNRCPDVKQKENDIKLLIEQKTVTLEKLKLSPSLLSDEFASFCFAELSPVCAIVGGVMGQEIIKAVSLKDQPHDNFFFYNGIEGSGLVDKITSS